ncbi:ST3 beta-galactoside alpha-2,3-sialyltransferase 8 [Astyanax mexicanus]|uniref:ST3 beta-galactoside alpha-2,3-sialyltransferase 8 n=1 Tax=Astyanax mexicanus TaxID=7994 RepID=UPI0020CADB23|nr:ST3 beta-galactoside alpha-2,3-sialyltransferase 8 [Astyanax mexicanus]
MLLKRKLCIAASFCGVVFFMFATHTIQKNSVLNVQMEAPPTTPRPQLKNHTRARVQTPPVRRRTCSCSTCISDPGESDWFDRRYDSSQHPYLTNQDQPIDPTALKWWLALQRSVDGTMEEVMRKMFSVISPPPGEELNPAGRCRTCAVVGNSGNLRDSKYGELIDAHSIVFRMNKATTVGFERDVGNKTTHHFMYPESAVDLQPGVHLVLLPFKLRDLQWVTSALSTGEIKTTYTRVKERVQAEKDKIIVVNPGFFKYTHDHWTEHHGRYPSTGMLAIVFALHLCDEVSVFGYGADLQGNWHHYWEENRYAGAFRKTGVHDADFESKIIQTLNSERKIKLYPQTEKLSDPELRERNE